MRRQGGTTSLRALLYFDEVFGFFPPTAEPPSKRPLLTLLKQARAFGLGVILVTQNPVDLDYKGLTNAGTWFIGKLQAERDKDRVLQGLKGAIAEAGGSGEKIDYDTTISQLGSRVFLLHNVHEDQPIVFHTRWVMSYLRGPLTKPQVKDLMAGRRGKVEVTKPVKPQPVSTPETPPATVPEEEGVPTGPEGYSITPPALAPEVPQVFLPIELGAQTAIRTASQEADQDVDALSVQLVYDPAIVGVAEVNFVDRKRGFDEKVEKLLLASQIGDLQGVDWDEAEWLPVRFRDLREDPERVEANQGPFFAPIPERANTARELKSIGTDLSDWLYYNSRLPIAVHPELDVAQEPGESERAFKIRVKQAARERRDAEVDALEEKYAIRIDKLEDKLRKKERELDSDEADHQARKQEELLGAGETVFSMLGGRRRSLSRVASRRRMTRKARLEMEETKEEIAEIEEDIAELDADLSEDVAEISQQWDDAMDQVTTEELKPRRTDVDVQIVALAWVPSWLIGYKEGRRIRTATVPAYSQAEVS
jgi:hypothetical protein